MKNIDGDALAEFVMKAYVAFDSRLHEKGRRRFPATEFKALFDAVVRYVEATKEESMIHRNVAGAISGLREILELKSFRAPGQAIADADRLECMIFAGYDPHFEGDEPPGL